MGWGQGGERLGVVLDVGVVGQVGRGGDDQGAVPMAAADRVRRAAVLVGALDHGLLDASDLAGVGEVHLLQKRRL